MNKPISDFSRQTIAVACKILTEINTHGDIALLEVKWGIDGRCRDTNKQFRAADIAKIAIDEAVRVNTTNGTVTLARAIIEEVIKAPEHIKNGDDWKEFENLLRFDKFVIDFEENYTEPPNAWSSGSTVKTPRLRRAYPDDLEEMKGAIIEDEINALLTKHNFITTKNHLSQALDNYSKGNWESANGQIRTFFESCFREIAAKFGYCGRQDFTEILKFLAQEKKLLFVDLNEWNSNNSKQQFFTGLWSRLHPDGSHPGISNEADCTFRLHISLISMRLLLLRFEKIQPSP